ncbi:MAG: response regulator [Desulfobacterales bacterium]|nr:response regulator [Desulfobacterales bacterium]
MRVLIVEDDPISALLLENFIKPYGDYEIAEDGEEALLKFLLAWSVNINKPFDVILLDINLPKKQGQEVLRKIREFEAKMGISGLLGVKIIMTTALGDHKSIMEAFKGQCEDYMVKPIEKAKLIQKLEKLGLIH